MVYDIRRPPLPAPASWAAHRNRAPRPRSVRLSPGLSMGMAPPRVAHPPARSRRLYHNFLGNQLGSFVKSMLLISFRNNLGHFLH